MIDFDEEQAPVDEEQLKKLSRLAEMQVATEDDIAKLEEQLKAKKKDLQKLAEKEIPELMTEIGMAEFKLTSGYGVKIEKGLTASITGKKKQPAIDWLVANGYGDIVSADLSVPFSNGERTKAVEMCSTLLEQGIIAKVSDDVNTGTLKSVIRERLEQGLPVPLETLGAYEWKKSVIER